MIDIKFVIKGLEDAKDVIRKSELTGGKKVRLIDACCNAVTLLKEQEPVKPHYNARTNWYECGACHYSMTSGMHCRGELIPAYKVGYCAKCGRAVMWNEI